MKRICILTSVHPPFDTRIFHKQAKTLAQAGYDVTLIAQHDRDEVVDGIKLMALPKPKNRFWRMLGTWRIFRLALRQKADIYHFHDPELLPAGLLLKLLTNGKVIYDVHEDVPEDILMKRWLPAGIRKPISYIFGVVEKMMASQLDHVITSTDYIAEQFKGTTRVTAIKNYPISYEFKLTPRHIFAQVTLIYVGGLCEDRGISETVKALAYLNAVKDVRLRLYGKFEPESYQEVVRRFKEFDRVDYMGWVKPEILWSNMCKATIGLLCLHPVPTFIESLPIKLFEYMAAGLPVIASNFPLWKEIVEGNNCGLTVDPLDPAEIAKAIEYLIEHPDEAKKMGENGRKAVLEKYNWETESRKLITLYELLCK